MLVTAWSVAGQAAGSARPGDDVGRPAPLARHRTGRDQHARTLRPGGGHRLGPSPPAAATPRRLGHPPRPAADRGRHPDPGASRPAARWPGPEAGVAVALPPRAGRPGRAAAVPRVPAPLRPGTHLPLPQADPRLDSPPAAPPRSSRPMDLDHPGRLHPTPPGPSPGRRPTPPLGETPRPRPADPRPRPATAPKPSRPGPGRPKGIRNSSPAPRYPVGKQSSVDTPKQRKKTKSP